MADRKVSQLAAVTPAAGDLLYLVDVSDTTDGAAGSSRRTTVGEAVALASVTTATATTLAATRLFASSGSAVRPAVLGTGFSIVGDVPLTQYAIEFNVNAGVGTNANGLLRGNGSAISALGIGSGLSVVGSDLVATGGGMAIGGTVTGGTAGRVLLVGTGPVLDDDPGLAFDAATGKLAVRAVAGTASDELHAYHDGANVWLENKDTAGNAHLFLLLGGGEYAAVKRSAGFEVAPQAAPRYLLGETNLRVGSGIRVGWSSAANPNSAANDTETYRASAGVVGVTVSATAPADAALSAGSVAFYTDVNGDLKIKLKDSGGVVRTGTVDLT